MIRHKETDKNWCAFVAFEVQNQRDEHQLTLLNRKPKKNPAGEYFKS